MGSWKLEEELGRSELPDLLRELARALESGRAEGLFSGLPADLRKLVLVAEDRDERLLLKLKAKRGGEIMVRRKAAKTAPAEPGARLPGGPKPPVGGRGRDKYRQLKKALQADYKALHRAVDSGAVPAQELVESFVGLCEAMADMEQPVVGAVGGAQAAELARASRACLDDAKALRAARGPAQLSEVLARLERRKSACHAQFK